MIREDLLTVTTTMDKVREKMKYDNKHYIYKIFSVFRSSRIRVTNPLLFECQDLIKTKNGISVICSRPTSNKVRNVS